MMPFSSNDKHFNSSNRTIYVLCGSKSEFDITQLENSADPKFSPNAATCREPFIPRTKSDLRRLTRIMDNFVFNTTYFDKAVRFWTDYVRVNKTHFWSENRNSWWSQCRSSDLYNPEYSKFSSVVVIDGHRKIRNMIARNKTGCICIGRVIEMRSNIGAKSNN